MQKFGLTIDDSDDREEFGNTLIVHGMLHNDVIDSVCLPRFVNSIFMFSVPRPPEIIDLEDKVKFKGEGILRVFLFLAANPLSANLTFNTIQKTIGWTDWAIAAIVPELVSLILVPLILYIIYPPSVKSSPDAPKLAQEKMEKMGPMSNNGWDDSSSYAESVAWDTLTWFAALIAMDGYLNKYGLLSWFSETVVKWSCPYRCDVHCFLVGRKCSRLGAIVLAFLSNIMGGLTHYGIGSAPVFYGANYVPLAQWWGYGFIISVVNLVIWLGIGGAWWKFLGLW
ncbi:unnamed protein product [Rhodiola kirilowii]